MSRAGLASGAHSVVGSSNAVSAGQAVANACEGTLLNSWLSQEGEWGAATSRVPCVGQACPHLSLPGDCCMLPHCSYNFQNSTPQRAWHL